MVESFKKIHPEMEIVLITDYASIDIAVRALNEGAFSYFKRPFIIEDLLIIVKIIIGKQKFLNEKRSAEQQLRESKNSIEKEVKIRTKELEVALEQQKQIS